MRINCQKKRIEMKSNIVDHHRMYVYMCIVCVCACVCSIVPLHSRVLKLSGGWFTGATKRELVGKFNGMKSKGNVFGSDLERVHCF